MITQDNPRWERLVDQFEQLPVALSLADLTAEDAPLISVNSKFKEMTGYTDEIIGQNCRFLQGAFDNTEARGEIRLALQDKRKTQVLLKNRRFDGEVFYNLLLIDVFCSRTGEPIIALGAQFDLGTEHPDRMASSGQNTLDDTQIQLKSRSEVLRLERDRVIATTASKLVRSWVILSELN